MDISVTYDAGNVLRMLASAPEIAREELIAGLEIMATRTESEVVVVTPRGVGGQAGLAGSIHHQVVAYGQGYRAHIGTPFVYGEPVEVGRKPGKMPPVAPIALWARRILGKSEKEARSVGFAIAHKIAVKGTKGAEMFGRTVRKLGSWYAYEADAIGVRIARRLINR